MNVINEIHYFDPHSIIVLVKYRNHSFICNRTMSYVNDFSDYEKDAYVRWMENTRPWYLDGCNDDKIEVLEIRYDLSNRQGKDQKTLNEIKRFYEQEYGIDKQSLTNSQKICDKYISDKFLYYRNLYKDVFRGVKSNMRNLLQDGRLFDSLLLVWNNLRHFITTDASRYSIWKDEDLSYDYKSILMFFKHYLTYCDKNNEHPFQDISTDRLNDFKIEIYKLFRDNVLWDYRDAAREIESIKLKYSK